MEKTVVLVKPDGVKRGLCGEIISRFEKVGLKIVAMKMVWVDEDFASKHYPVKRKEWVKNIGVRALETYQEYGYDPKEDIANLDPEAMGELMVKWLLDALTAGPVVAILLEGLGAVKTVRKMVGHTFPDKAVPGTIRGDFSSDWGLTFKSGRAGRNVVHASGNPEEAKFEEELWFHKKEIHAYKRVDEDLIYG
jgi:nucleoside-diphosphate kinase